MGVSSYNKTWPEVRRTAEAGRWMAIAIARHGQKYGVLQRPAGIARHGQKYSILQRPAGSKTWPDKQAPPPTPLPPTLPPYSLT